MAKYIVSLDNQGYRLQQAIINYCTATGHEVSVVRTRQIFETCLRDVIRAYGDGQDALRANIHCVPDFRTIHFVEGPINYEIVKPFTEEVRAFAYWLYGRLTHKEVIQPNHFYMYESGDYSYVIISAYQDAAYV